MGEWIIQEAWPHRLCLFFAVPSLHGRELAAAKTKGADMNLIFITNSIALGVGLAMDAFSVSIANGLNEPGMSRRKMCGIAGTYAGYQFAMPMIGWFCVHTIAEQFEVFRGFIPWIALALLAWIGGKMLIEGIRKNKEDATAKANAEDQACPSAGSSATPDESGKTGACLGFGTLMLQGIATSIDALSVGFTIADYGTGAALTCSLLVAVTTFIICMSGLLFGKRFGERLADKATILGGVILIAIGVEIFVKGVL